MRGGVGVFVAAALLAYGVALLVLAVGLWLATMALASGYRW